MLGIVLGWHLARQRRGNENAVERNSRLMRLAGRLYALLQNMQNDVDTHQDEMAAIDKELTAIVPASGPTGDSVTQMVHNILKSNSHLREQLQVAEEKLQVQRVQMEDNFTKARTDPLTNLPNRRAFDETLVQWMGQWRRGRPSFGLILIDLDQLKMLNDQGGHLTGDYVLRNLGKLLHDGLLAGEFATRMGGDEFAMLVADSDLEKTCRRAEEYRAAVAKQRFCFEQRQWPVSVSLGVAQICSGDHGTDLIRRADHALATAKRAGRNCGYFHDGQICRAISAVGHSASDDTLLIQLCDDLREHVASVVDRLPPPSKGEFAKAFYPEVE
jgi:diguanylate cyclase